MVLMLVKVELVLGLLDRVIHPLRRLIGGDHGVNRDVLTAEFQCVRVCYGPALRVSEV